MSDSAAPDAALPLRRGVYALLLIASVAGMLGRLVNVSASHGRTPFLSANDRSRWATIRALVDHGTYELDAVIVDSRTGQFDKDWHTIDLVRHRGADGREHYYSSKPPLLATLLAGHYWLMQQTSGVRFAEQPYYVARWTLAVWQVLPTALALAIIVGLIERHGRTDWGRLFAAAAAAFGTLLTNFAVTLNNHTAAAVCVAVALWALLRIAQPGSLSWAPFAVAGGFTALAATNDLPALALFALSAVYCGWRSPVRFLAAFAPAAAIVAAAFFGTTYYAHGSLRPPYAHRSDGPVVTTIPGSHAEQFAAGETPLALRERLAEFDLPISAAAVVRPTAIDRRWMLWDKAEQLRFALVERGDAIEVRQWDNWYEYERSYWTDDRKRGVDRGEPSRWTYAFHVLVGHHGVFSLTPIWLLSLGGVLLALRGHAPPLKQLAVATLLLTVVCLAFYLSRGQIDRNYGGVANGFRWLFWLIPLWLVMLTPAVDWIATRPVWRWVAYLLLAVSIFSASYNGLNPWRHPWIFQYAETMGWIDYS